VVNHHHLGATSGGPSPHLNLPNLNLLGFQGQFANNSTGLADRRRPDRRRDQGLTYDNLRNGA